MPPQDGMPPISDADKNKVMHVTLPIGGETVLMGSDAKVRRAYIEEHALNISDEDLDA